MEQPKERKRGPLSEGTPAANEQISGLKEQVSNMQLEIDILKATLDVLKKTQFLSAPPYQYRF